LEVVDVEASSVDVGDDAGDFIEEVGGGGELSRDDVVLGFSLEGLEGVLVLLIDEAGGEGEVVEACELVVGVSPAVSDSDA
jgi:hypothetical protein